MKYRNRPDISFLVVEKNTNPLESEDSRHNIETIAYFLRGYGFTVDLVWSLIEYKFKNFDIFCKGIVKELESKMQRYEDDWFMKDIIKRDIGKFESLQSILRKTPITSLKDLEPYDFLILHADFEDCEKKLPKIVKRYPKKPIITPYESISAGNIKSERLEALLQGPVKLPFDFATKDPDFEAYIVHGEGTRFCYNTIELIEYILDQREST